jgi:hypothetical protein
MKPKGFAFSPLARGAAISSILGFYDALEGTRNVNAL